MNTNCTTDITHSVVSEALNYYVSVETIDGSIVKGKLIRYDEHTGNAELIDVECQTRDSSLSVFERFFLKGANIRIIHLPPDLCKSPLLDWQNSSMRQALKKTIKPNRSVRKNKTALRTTNKLLKQQKGK
ncbi:unnamed protein product [Phytomonas sp. Hart1]|nr:unnamed protein product [Phytomonas sp. Hart1]|eukprot:CCW67087.1 unnamed protein product [Phytomonas sp. isolate Hart1]